MSRKQGSKSAALNTLKSTSNKEAQGLMEYALIIVLVAVIVLVVLAILGPGVGNMFSNVINKI